MSAPGSHVTDGLLVVEAKNLESQPSSVHPSKHNTLERDQQVQFQQKDEGNQKQPLKGNDIE